MNKLILTVLFILISIASFAFETPHQTSSLTIATYNLWNPIFEEKYSGQSTWHQRLPFIIENIISSKSDILCLEEVGKNEYLDLIQNLEINTQYTFFYISHAPSKLGQKEGRDGLAFFYNPEKVTFLKLIQSKEGTRPTHRRDFYVDLKLSDQSGIPIQFRIACTHLDSDKDLTIGNTQLSALVEDVQKDGKGIDFVVLCGDFNEGESEILRPRYEIMHNAGFFTDGSLEATRPEALDVRHKGHIDWIYFKKTSGLNFELTSQPPLGDERGSDHKLTRTIVEFKNS